MSLPLNARRIGGWLKWPAIGVVLMTTGCEITGHWTGNSLTPEMARDQFKILRPDGVPGKFVSADFRFQKDNSYTADINYDGKLESHQGTYKYDDGKKTLMLRDKAGNSYMFAAKKVDDKTLQLIKSIKGSDVTLTLTKE
jgi:hypothetical protein